MPVRSFKQSVDLPPPRYRTPSPPLDAVEPNSPTFSEDNGNEELGMSWGSERRQYNEVKKRKHARNAGIARGRKPSAASRSTMDSLASIALATDANSALHQNVQSVDLRVEDVAELQQSYQERPHKRSRSEKLPSPELHRTVPRPATSYTQSFDVNTSDAELLLGLWPQILSHEPCSAQSLYRFVPRQDLSYGSTSVSNAAEDKTHDPRADHRFIQSQGLPPPPLGDPETQPDNDPQRPDTTPFAPLFSNEQQFVTTHQRDSPDAGLVAKISPEQVCLEDGVLPEVVVDTGRPESSDPPTRAWDTSAHGGTSQTGPPTHPNDHISTFREPTADASAIKQDGVEHPDQAVPQSEPQPPEASLDSSAPPRDGENFGPLVSSEISTEEMRKKSLHDPENLVRGTSPENIADDAEYKARQAHAQAVCAACNFTRNTLDVENESDATSWISCDGCKAWFHFACAGFKSEREVRSVDKYRCRKCKPSLGPTTYVRKSARAHTAIDYAGLNEGVIKTSDESPEHHYLKPIKDGTITFQPETFPRMRPELVTAEYFEKGNGMKEPVVIPASMNPRPTLPTMSMNSDSSNKEGTLGGSAVFEKPVVDEWFEYEEGPDYGQDALDMVIPQNLTVRRVAELYGLEEKVEVIDVKSQNGEDKKWNMRRWADYYESRGNKIVRNVISLEVSQSKLGRLIRRPRIVRDLDLQDAVWPAELQAKIDFPKVQFYCLMSVADCFTDFHIDFGGSSVFYHILKGKKTFLFIPPKEKHLKKYEEWCMSPAQNWTFLADQTKECYRVDLSEGDTMLIPSGWIHAVWTPEDSLVIGGNFLTRMNYAMQIRIAQIEKVTGVARKFRYPHFQKVLWYTALHYLEEDPLPASVSQAFENGDRFHREQPSFYDFDAWGDDSKPGGENYHARYYSQAELEGLPDLTRYLLRTALIAMGSITEGITVETRNAVKRSIPKGQGEPLDIVKGFAKWCAWKRGNEPIPHWAYADHVPEGGAPETAEKRLSTAAVRRLDREAALQAYRVAPERQSTRRQSQRQGATSDGAKTFPDGDPSNSILQRDIPGVSGLVNPVTPISSIKTSHKRKPSVNSTDVSLDGKNRGASKRRKITFGSTGSASKGPACESCRKRRRACKHRGQRKLSVAPFEDRYVSVEPSITVNVQPSGNALAWQHPEGSLGNGSMQHQRRGMNEEFDVTDISKSRPCASSELSWHTHFRSSPEDGRPEKLTQQMLHVEIVRGEPSKPDQLPASLEPTSMSITTEVTRALPGSEKMPHGAVPGKSHGGSKSPDNRQGRSRACNECRKSKVCISPLSLAQRTDMLYQRRCVHDQNGNEDPIKVREAAMPRVAGTPKRRHVSGEPLQGSIHKRSKRSPGVQPNGFPESTTPNPPLSRVEAQWQASVPVMVGSTLEPDPQQHTYTIPLPVNDSSNLASQAVVQPDAINNLDLASSNKDTLVTVSHATGEAASPDPQAPPEQIPLEATDNIEDEVQLVATSPPPRDLKVEANFISVPPEPSRTFSQPPASSFISPPASTHTDAEGTPPAPHVSVTPSTLSSRHSSRQPKQVQRYTPESGSARRASSSTADGMTGRRASTSTAGGAVMEKSASPTVGLSTPGAAREAAHKRSKASLGADDAESLRLIKELQAQDYGLRRRGRA